MRQVRRKLEGAQAETVQRILVDLAHARANAEAAREALKDRYTAFTRALVLLEPDMDRESGLKFDPQTLEFYTE